MPPFNDSHPPTWDELTRQLQSGAGSVARHDVGVWAIGRVREALGEDWPQRWYARFGDLPAYLHHPGSDAVAYAQLVATGLRLSAVGDVPRLRRLTKEWSRDLSRDPPQEPAHQHGALTDARLDNPSRTLC